MKKRRDVAQRFEQIKRAIRNIESEQPLKEWGPKDVSEELERQKIPIPYRRMIWYLNRLAEPQSRYIRQISRGRYLSKKSLFWKKAFQEFLINEVYETMPKLDDNEIQNMVLDSFSSVLELRLLGYSTGKN